MPASIMRKRNLLSAFAIFAHGYVPNYSGALSESFPRAPEQGIYFGATFHPEEIIKLGFYYDRFRIMSTSGDPDRNGEEIFAGLLC